MKPTTIALAPYWPRLLGRYYQQSVLKDTVPAVLFWEWLELEFGATRTTTHQLATNCELEFKNPNDQSIFLLKLS
jgi:hypothetical protein